MQQDHRITLGAASIHGAKRRRQDQRHDESATDRAAPNTRSDHLPGRGWTRLSRVH